MEKTNRFLNIGLLIYAVTMVLNHLVGLPHFLYGLGLGTAIGFELLGVAAMRYDLSKLRSYKLKIIKR